MQTRQTKSTTIGGRTECSSLQLTQVSRELRVSRYREASGLLTLALAWLFFCAFFHSAAPQQDQSFGLLDTINNSIKQLLFLTGRLPIMTDIQNPVPAPVPTEAQPMRTPVIGVITQVLRDFKRFVDTRHLHLPASYVKWIESSGAQVLPILLNQDDSYYEQVFAQTNGLLLPGGDNQLDPDKRTPMMEAAKRLYRLALDANDRGDFYPIWGTCLGLELLSVLTANRNVLVTCSATDLALKMDFVERGKMFAPGHSDDFNLTSDFAGQVLESLSTKPISYHYHHKCLTDEAFKVANLDKFYRPLAYSTDRQGLRFISIMEAIKYPFYGVQFHPEKAPFEFQVKQSQHNIPHSVQARAVSRYFADFFVDQARKNTHNKIGDLAHLLIYNYKPMNTGIMHDMYEQRYLFPFHNTYNLSTEEFFYDLDPDDTEQVVYST